METLDSLGGTSFDTRGLIGRIYVGDHYPLLHTKYISCGARGFRDFFKVFPNISLWSPYQMMLYMKFDQNWPSDFSMGVSSKCPIS